MFNPVSNSVSFPELEKDTLNFWRDRDIFRESLRQRQGAEAYVFYDGPPFATGLPHYGHLLAGTIKDVIPRYQTMTGKYVDRTFGWDCHGLPVENEMEKELGINSKHEIEEYGVDKFNEACRSIVLRYTEEWEHIVERTGRWVDFEKGYRTMDRDYMESIWWVFKQLWDKGLVYEGHKIMWYCPRCATPLSNFEVNQGYEEVEDPAITVRFKVFGDDNRYFLAWTTTPWTLPANLALTVGPEIDYVEVADGDARYILGADLVPVYWKDQAPEIIARFKGADLIGLEYEPIFPYFCELRNSGAFRVIGAEFVSTDEGTGIVHTAPGFGEDDAAAAKANDVPAVCPIDDEGCYTAEVPDYHSRFVKDCDKDIIRRLKDEKNLVHRGVHKHNYPHCWRCDSPLLNKAIATWFVRVEKLKDRLLSANAQIRWVPEHLKEGRFGKWLENARDWAISRNRYWGCPLPIWRNADTGEIVCVGSVAELEELCGEKVDDIHKHFVDEITLPGQDGTRLTRVPEVLDCWFESGSMPYAQNHYPFENKDWLEQHFPADFIAEGLDQTRGWFYTLVVLGTALFDKPAFKNVVVNGLVLAEDGRKMSKRLKNYPDPNYIMDTYGADAMRLCLLSSPVVRGEDLRFSESAVKDVMRSVILPLWNAYSFLVTYARVDEWTPSGDVAAPPKNPENELDRWILARLQSTVADVREGMDNYELQRAAVRFTGFIEDLTNWYIRRSRRRFWKSTNDTDKNQAYATLHFVLTTFCKIAAPFIPFVTDEIWQNLRTPQMPESVHLCDFPEPLQAYMDEALERRMGHAMTAVSLGRHLRTQTTLKVRQPLAEAVLVSADPVVREDLQAMAGTIAEELNVKSVDVRQDEEALVHIGAKPNFRSLGPKLGHNMKSANQQIGALTAETIRALRDGDTITLEFDDGGSAEIAFDDILVQREEREGMTVANEGAVTVALDTRLTDDLILEGWARELVSRIQNIRKEIGLEVSDRIVIRHDLPEKAAQAIEQFADYIGNETLAVSIEAASLNGGESMDINGEACRFEIVKA
jgi:isoleucyl-tRNA synthetase